MKRLLYLLLPLTFAGCQQARSFLHMNSNSSSPFMGFELSVDARDTHDRNAVSLQYADDGRVTSTSDIKAVRAERGQKADAQPTMDLASHPVDATEVEDIMSRIAGS